MVVGTCGKHRRDATWGATVLKGYWGEEREGRKGAGKKVLETPCGIGTALLFALEGRRGKIHGDGKRYVPVVSAPGFARRREVEGTNRDDSRRKD